jgi:hypothetical protein
MSMDVGSDRSHWPGVIIFGVIVTIALMLVIFHTGKDEGREEVYTEICQSHGMALVQDMNGGGYSCANETGTRGLFAAEEK